MRRRSGAPYLLDQRHSTRPEHKQSHRDRYWLLGLPNGAGAANAFACLARGPLVSIVVPAAFLLVAGWFLAQAWRSRHGEMQTTLESGLAIALVPFFAIAARWLLSL